MNTCPVLLGVLLIVGHAAAAPAKSTAHRPGVPAWRLPEAHDVRLGGSLGEACDLGVRRLSLAPYDSPVYLRSDFSFETNRIFVNYSGDISGRFIQVASLVCPPGQMPLPTLPEVLRDLAKYQQRDGHFGREVDWSLPLEPESSSAVLLPIFWGNSRLLVGLVEAYQAFGREDCLAAARRMGDFYIATASRFLDPAREAEYRMTGTYAAGYPTDYFPGIEGLALLYRVTKDPRYLAQAERMAEYFQGFDTLPIDHSHGNLITHYGLLLLYEATGKAQYLERPLARWQQAVEGGYIWPMGGVGEKFRVSFERDEGCSEADWLRLNLQLWKLTGQTRFLDLAERLLWNHYAMNRTANGGYGHHEFVCDPEGPLLMQKQFTEAVWCCTFHGLLGMQTLKRYLVAGSAKAVVVNFPVEVSAPVQTDQGRWQVSVRPAEAAAGELQCQVRLDPIAGARKAPEVRVRRPYWAFAVAAADAEGRKVRTREEAGYLCFTAQPGAGGAVTLAFAAAPRIEDRRLRPVSPDPNVISRLSGVTLFVGPHLLLANQDQPRPVVVARISKRGQLLLPSPARLLKVDSLQATEEQMARATASGSLLALTPWESTRHDAAAAFVFDLILVPETSPLAQHIYP
jgi:DUF1680 family protein